MSKVEVKKLPNIMIFAYDIVENQPNFIVYAGDNLRLIKALNTLEDHFELSLQKGIKISMIAIN